MKYSKLFNRSLLAALVALATTACADDIETGSAQLPEFGGGSAEELLYVTDANGSTATQSVEVRHNTTVPLYVNITKAVAADNSVTFTYDEAALDSYNRAHGTSIEAIPAEWVSFSNGGVATIPAGELKSTALEMTIASDGSLDSEAGYAVPLRVSAGSRVAVASASQLMVILVRDLSAIPDCFKTWVDDNGVEHEGVKVFSCMEVNDTNPLNNLKYTLKKSGKYLIDALIIFSANINYNTETGQVYCYCNPNVQALLDGREKYLKPLKDRGIKVILGILGNHDRAAINNLADETARYFAKELKSICDAYDLDGIFWDDEYSKPISPAPSGFVTPSTAAASRLIYEVWKVQPERWNIAYVWASTRSLYEVDGVKPGVYCQYALHDYGGSYDLSSNYPGMPKSNMGLYSQQFNYGDFASESSLKYMRDNGYGANMIFAMDPNRDNARNQEQALDRMARVLYDDELVVDPTNYPKDWD